MHTNVIVSISPIDEILYLLDLLVNFISTCFVKCKLHIDNIQFFLLLWSKGVKRNIYRGKFLEYIRSKKGKLCRTGILT
jgi:hypothetical protein